MKVSINCKNIGGSYGGVIAFSRSIRKHLENHGYKTTNDLQNDDIDIILLASYATWSTATYNYLDALAYKLLHPDCIIVERINECDERKGTDYMNKLLIKIAERSDFLVFIASWLKPLLQNAGLPGEKPSQVILNGADKEIFNSTGGTVWNRKEKMKIVTHHWGGGYLKGHEIYQLLDKMLDESKYKDRFEFTFIGNRPKSLIYKNTKFFDSMYEQELAQELKKHHVYLTASLNEPAGMHHIEGAMCGLPLLYIKSGSLPEYCSGFGIEFEKENFKEKLEEMHKNYFTLKEKMEDYKQNSDRMNTEYTDLFLKLLAERKKKETRNFFKNSISALFLKIYSKIDSLFLRIKIHFSSSKISS